MSDQDFFAELQSDFLAEAAFMLEQYEENMLGLESGKHPEEDLAAIFRVAHSVKGGAAAVGFADLGKFAHAMEDLLALLRVNPGHINEQVISALLESGDMLKKRVQQLQTGETAVWDTAQLEARLIQFTQSFGGTISAMPEMPSQAPTLVQSNEHQSQEDHTNHELLAELMAEMAASNSELEASQSESPAPEAKVAPVVQLVYTKVEAKVEKEEKPTEKTEKRSMGNRGISSSIKVDTARVDSVLDAVGELVVLKNQLVHDDAVKKGDNARLAGIVDQLDKTVRELYDKTLSIRMTPLKSLFLKIQRIVRDLSINLGKPVDLQMIGEETEVERTVFELLGDPLVHLARNAMDHGLERPEIRKEKGKNPVGKLTVSAKQSGGSVIIEIIEDGAGINRDKVLQKAIDRKLIPEGIDPLSLSDDQIHQFIFAPGFSTAERVSDLSGRGVGMDVVKSNLDRIHGKIDIRSRNNEGTIFRLSIPLSTAITDGIVVAIDGSRFILPIHNIREIVRCLPSEFTHVASGMVVRIREVLLPVIDINKTIGKINWTQLENLRYKVDAGKNSLRSRRDESMLVIIESMYGQMALPVQDVIGQAQVVVKAMTSIQNVPEVSGAAIMGDGRTILILDPTALVQQRKNEIGSAA